MQANHFDRSEQHYSLLNHLLVLRSVGSKTLTLHSVKAGSLWNTQFAPAWKRKTRGNSHWIGRDLTYLHVCCRSSLNCPGRWLHLPSQPTTAWSPKRSRLWICTGKLGVSIREAADFAWIQWKWNRLVRSKTLKRQGIGNLRLQWKAEDWFHILSNTLLACYW